MLRLAIFACSLLTVGGMGFWTIALLALFGVVSSAGDFQTAAGMVAGLGILMGSILSLGTGLEVEVEEPGAETPEEGW